jgi:serine/threonine-protein phosphatase 5
MTVEVNPQAEELKNQGNLKFKEKKYSEAVEYYTKAIEIQPTSVYYCNRSLNHIHLENYGLALQDAEEAIKLDPKNPKAYFRRGTAYLALAKFKEAKIDFQKVVQLHPGDKIAKSKLALCIQEIRSIEFLKAIESENSKPISETLEWWSLTVNSDYDGMKLDIPNGCKDVDNIDIPMEWVEDMVERFKNQKKIHYKYAVIVLLKAIKLFQSMKSLYHINVPADKEITVCGDTHGQFYDLLNIFKLNGMPSEENPYLFNGDFVDRGSFSCEIILSLLAFKVACPSSIHLTRGNHESRDLNKMYGFQGEVKAKYNETLFELFQEVFNWLPLAAVINNKVIVVHGGIPSQDGVKLADIEKINRNCPIPPDGIMCDLLWADPQKAQGKGVNKRGVSYTYGPDHTKRFLDENQLELLVRSHEVKMDGYEVEADGRLVTLFSAPNYCDSVNNKGALIRFKGSDMKPNYIQFSAVPHPNVKPMAYSSPLFNLA